MPDEDVQEFKSKNEHFEQCHLFDKKALEWRDKWDEMSWSKKNVDLNRIWMDKTVVDSIANDINMGSK